ncbi:Tetracycline resistance protein [Durusdinium trenchii]|uniref:Class D (TetA(D)) n=1 Tax=Durusdinium trenchii TaxID=1381693 RepID=A0ABP0IDG3_9DINO
MGVVSTLCAGIAISTIPLHLLSFGATPLQVGLATSCFSVAQMVCCPALVSASSKFGRLRVLRTCLAGAAFASMLISLSSNIPGILLGRFLAGAFGASVPVAQAAVTDIVSEGAATALSRVAAAAQLGVVVGPAASAFLAALLGKAFGWPSSLCVRGVFGLTGIVSTYCLFANRCLGYDQQKLSLVFSTGAATTVLTQLLLFPTLVWDLRGPQGTCFLGICCVALGLSGFSLCWLQPGHMLFYLLVRMGSGCADTSTATLVAENSKPKDRAQNLGFITSTRAATRIVTPIVSADLFEASLNSRAAPGALPYLLASSLAAGLSPVPLMLRGKS